MSRITIKELFLMAFVAANTYWCVFWAIVYADSLLDNNGLFSVDCNYYGEGWSEVIIFILMSLIGIGLLITIFRGDWYNDR